jgi:hypothetical protein
MQSGSRYIIATGISALCVSLFYFLSLALHVPFVLTVPVIFASVCTIYVLVVKGMKPVDNKIPHPVWAWLILLAGVIFITINFLQVAEKYGGWDAWGIWNLHARYLADAANWKKMFDNISYAHPDYPLYIPAVNGFFIRLFSEKYLMVIPFIFHFSITLFIPVLIYIENVKKNTAVAAAIFFLFATDTFYLTKGATQYADTPLAFFLLCAFVCINYAGESKKYIAMAAACLGGCIWTKNEGSILALVFIIFYAKTFLSLKNIRAFAVGFGIPAILFFLFKVFYVPAGGGISASFDKNMLSQLFVKDRYDMIWDFFKDNVAKKYFYVKICLFIYLLLCLIEWKRPGKQFFVIFGCVVVYTMVYVLTPGSIEWLLGTSQERLMHQLMPALMYVFSQRFSRVQILLPKQQVL